MKVFITGTDTDVGKTTVSGWLCLHTGYSYFKPIQSGSDSLDSHEVKKLSDTGIHKESFLFKEPLSPHLAASLEKRSIDLDEIKLPEANDLIIEGAGGLLVPINESALMIDLIRKLAAPVILVARSTLGTINHTLLSLEALRARNIKTLGVILNGPYNQDNLEAIEFYGKVEVLASIPHLQHVSKKDLMQIPLPSRLKNIFEV